MIPVFNGNWVDLAVALYLLAQFISGIRKGFLTMLINIAGLIAAIIISFKTYSYSTSFLAKNFSIDASYASLAGFFISVFIVKIVISILIHLALPKAVFKANDSILSKIIGGIAHFLYGFLIAFMIFLTIFSFSPLSFINDALYASEFGKFVVRDPFRVNNILKNTFGDMLKIAINKIDFGNLRPGK